MPELERYILNKLLEVDLSIEENLKNYNFHKLYKDLLNFCTLELSSFYFDIRKDTLYCDNVNSEKRKKCITVLNIILECLLKWLAPIFVFTTEEIYSLIKKDDKSIHETVFVSIPKKWKNDELDKKWKELLKIKQEANIAIEQKRSNKEIGSSLEAEIEIYTTNENFKLMEDLDLAEYFITSKAKKFVNENDEEKTNIIVKKSEGKKCERCWKILENECERCANIIKGIA